jgi:hypothetical protein
MDDCKKDIESLAMGFITIVTTFVMFLSIAQMNG